MKRTSISHDFVGAIPVQLEEGKLYVSIRYRTAVHLCACGCGNKVVTPIKPPRWHLSYDGESVSLAPSVGSHQFPCRSHYWIENDKIRWARPWTDEEVKAGHLRDAKDMRLYYAARATDAAAPAPAPISQANTGSWMSRLWSRLRPSRRN
jgi:hypothetical protein